MRESILGIPVGPGVLGGQFPQPRVGAGKANRAAEDTQQARVGLYLGGLVSAVPLGFLLRSL